jgi:hypothetical protein
MSAKPYSTMIEILRSVLQQVERNLSLKPGDQDLGTLKQSLLRAIGSLSESAKRQENGPGMELSDTRNCCKKTDAQTSAWDWSQSLSTHTKPEGQPRKVWTTPKITRIDLKNPRYSDIVDILRATLKQAEKDAAQNPGNQKAAELKRALQRTLDGLESSTEQQRRA